MPAANLGKVNRFTEHRKTVLLKELLIKSKKTALRFPKPFVFRKEDFSQLNRLNLSTPKGFNSQ